MRLLIAILGLVSGVSAPTLCYPRECAEEYPYSSARTSFDLDGAPQGLKPLARGERDAARHEGAPLQNKIANTRAAIVSLDTKNKTA